MFVCVCVSLDKKLYICLNDKNIINSFLFFNYCMSKRMSETNVKKMLPFLLLI
jgi:hypothetical protein